MMFSVEKDRPILMFAIYLVAFFGTIIVSHLFARFS